MSKILFLTPHFSPNIGGAETFQDQLLAEAKKWHDLTVLTFQPFHSQARKYEELFYKRGSLKILRMNWFLKQTGAWKGTGMFNVISVVPQMITQALLLCFSRKYQIIHAQGLISALVGVILKKVFRIRLLVTLLALYDFKDWAGIKYKVAKYILKNCDVIFVEGQHGAKDLDTFGLAEDKIRLFNHWVDTSVFRPPQSRDNSTIRVLFIGRPIREKGRHIIEGAERILCERFPKKFTFQYITNAPHKELVKSYQDSHIVVVPSLYSEGYSRVVAEAASCGCAVITSNRGSLPEMVKDFGISIEPTAENFAGAIEDLSDPERIRGTIAYGYSLQKFSPKNAEIFLEEYGN